MRFDEFYRGNSRIILDCWVCSIILKTLPAAGYLDTMFYLDFSSELMGRQAWFVNWFCSSFLYIQHIFKRFENF